MEIQVFLSFWEIYKPDLDDCYKYKVQHFLLQLCKPIRLVCFYYSTGFVICPMLKID